MREASIGTYVEEISENNVRFVLGKFNDPLGESFVHEDALPTRDSCIKMLAVASHNHRKFN